MGADSLPHLLCERGVLVKVMPADVANITHSFQCLNKIEVCFSLTQRLSVGVPGRQAAFHG